MKKQFYFPLVLVLLFMSTSVFGQLQLGAGLAYGTDIDDGSIGIQVRGIYGITEQWGAGADFIFYLIGEDDVSAYEFNANAHYIFSNTEKFTLYGLAGINVIRIEVDAGPFGSISASETGLNIGAGGKMAFTEKLSGIAEVKYAISDADQLVLAAGILFNL